MAASDPTFGVATPTGVLEGVAAFGWDGSQWQPSGRAAYGVGTPTGVLRGVAPFSWSGSAWTPAGQAGPGVATPSGVLQGVAVYTWNGSAWTPAGGGPSSSTPTGALRGVAAFTWDGSAWQPAAQAGPDVATPFGVLQGVAMFNWSGAAWAPSAGIPAGATLNLNFMNAGALDPLLTFTRASTGTYFDSGGVMRTAGLNLALQSAAMDNATWQKGGSGAVAPVLTGSQPGAPDGTSTAAQITYPAVSTASTYSMVYQAISIAASVQYTFSVFLKGTVGGEQIYVAITGIGGAVRNRVTLTTQWQRFSVTTGVIAAAITGTFMIGTDLRDVGQSATSAQTVLAWGPQVELGSVATQYAPTTTAANSSPRWDYDPVSLQLRGLLLEDQRTNAAISSSDYTGATYNKSGVTVALNGPTSPDGVSLMTTVTEGVAASNHSFYSANNLSVTAATWTYSVFVRPGTQRYISMRGNAADAVPNLPWITFDTQTRTINANASVTSSGFLALPGGTFRIWMTAPSTATATGAMVVAGSNIATAPVQSSSLGNSYTGTSQTWYAWGLQAELGDFATSFIPTTGAAVTRSIDSCLIPPANVSPWFAPPGGSWFAEFDSIMPALSGRTPRVLSNPVTAGSAGPMYMGQTARLGQYDTAGFVETVNSITVNTITKGATNWAVGASKSCLNGGAIATNTTTMTTGYGLLSTTGIGILSATAAERLSGHIRRVQYYPRVLADTEMQSLTTITDPSLFLNFMNPNTLDPRITFTRASTATYTDVNGVVQTANNDTPRWDYDPVTHALRGLLLEEARTNIVFPCIPAAGAWGQTGLSIVSGAGIAPDGNNTFAKLSETAVTSGHYSIVMGTLLTITSGQPYTFSIHAKAGENRYLQLIFDNNAAVGTNATFDLQAGTVTGSPVNGGGATGSAATMIALGNGVYRCMLTSNLGANTTGRFAVQNSINPTPAGSYGGNSYPGVAGNGVFVWGAQLELGAFPTSFILTTGSTVTRAADVCQITSGNMGWYSAAASSLFGEFYIPGALPSPTPNVRELCGLSDGTTANRLVLRALGALSSNGVFYSSVTGTNNVSAALPALTADAISKQAAAWNGTTGHGTANGGAIVSVNSALPGGINLFMIGNNSPGANATISGYVRAVRYWPRVLSDAEMQQVTT